MPLIHLSEEKVEIDGENIFEVREYVTKPENECGFESHKEIFWYSVYGRGRKNTSGFIPLNEELKKDTEPAVETRDLEFYQFPSKRKNPSEKKVILR